VRIKVSPASLPVQLEVAPSLLSRGAGVVADEVLRLCLRARAR
jgi:hypothetical protein